MPRLVQRLKRHLVVFIVMRLLQDTSDPVIGFRTYSTSYNKHDYIQNGASSDTITIHHHLPIQYLNDTHESLLMIVLRRWWFRNGISHTRTLVRSNLLPSHRLRLLLLSCSTSSGMVFLLCRTIGLIYILSNLRDNLNWHSRKNQRFSKVQPHWQPKFNRFFIYIITNFLPHLLI